MIRCVSGRRRANRGPSGDCDHSCARCRHRALSRLPRVVSRPDLACLTGGLPPSSHPKPSFLRPVCLGTSVISGGKSRTNSSTAETTSRRGRPATTTFTRPRRHNLHPASPATIFGPALNPTSHPAPPPRSSSGPAAAIFHPAPPPRPSTAPPPQPPTPHRHHNLPLRPPATIFTRPAATTSHPRRHDFQDPGIWRSIETVALPAPP